MDRYADISDSVCCTEYILDLTESSTATLMVLVEHVMNLFMAGLAQYRTETDECFVVLAQYCTETDDCFVALLLRLEEVWSVVGIAHVALPAQQEIWITRLRIDSYIHREEVRSVDVDGFAS